MDRHEFEHKGQRCYVADEGRRVALAVPFVDSQKREDVAAAEILRLAESEQKLRDTLQSERSTIEETLAENARLQEERDALNNALQGDVRALLLALGLGDHARARSPHMVVQHDVLPAVATLRDERDALKLSVEEAQEIIGELAAWRALQEGNRAAAERIQAAERLAASFRDKLDTLLPEINDQRESGEEAVDTLRRLIRERGEAQERLAGSRAAVEALRAARLAAEAERDQARADHKRAIEKCQETENARVILLGDLRRLRDEQRVLSEECAQIRGDYIVCARERLLARERADAADKNAEQFRRDLILALQDKDRLAQEKEAAESANRQYCLELAEKAGEIRRLEGQLAVVREHATRTDAEAEIGAGATARRLAAAGAEIRELRGQLEAAKRDQQALGMGQEQREPPVPGSAQGERRAILAYLEEIMDDCRKDGDSKYGDFVRSLTEKIAAGDHVPPVAPEG